MSHNVAECPTSQNTRSSIQNAQSVPESAIQNPLGPKQIQALSLLASGHTDAAVARKLSLNRKTINRWRLYDPLFASRLNRLRIALWANTLDRLRALLPKSLAVLSQSLHSDNPSARLRAAIQLLKIAGTSRLATRVGPDNLRDVLFDRARQHRAHEYSPALLRTMSPPDDQDLEELHHALLKHIAEEESTDAPRPAPSPAAEPASPDAAQPTPTPEAP